MYLKIFITVILLKSVLASVLPSQEFISCQKEYDEQIGELIASSGMSAASTVWKILFNSLDLNNNQIVSASEVVLKLNNEKLVSSDKMRSLLPQAQAWINSARSQDGDRELSLAEFTDVVGVTIGRVEKTSSINRDWMDTVSNLCAYFNQHVPELTRAIKDLSNCTYSLKKEQIKSMESSSSSLVLNLWKAAFRTVDADGNSHVSHDELAAGYLSFNSDSNMSRSIITSYFRAFLQQDVMDKPRFLSAVTKLLFGVEDNQVWMNLSSTDELRGKQLFCTTIHSLRNNVLKELNKNKECIDTYNNTVNRLLGEDRFIASGYIFTIVDSNRDGKVNMEELDNFVTGHKNSDFSSATLFNGNEGVYFNSKNITSLMPDRIDQASENENPLELTVFSCEQHKAWNALCMRAIHAVTTFPSSIEVEEVTTEPPTSGLYIKYKDLLGQLETSHLNDEEISHLIPKTLQRFLASRSTDIPATVSSENDIQSTSLDTLLTNISTNQETTVETATLEVNSVETTSQPDIQSTSLESEALTMTTSKVDSLSGVVRNVIKDLEKENSTGEDGAMDKEMESLLEQLDTAASGKNGAKEEQKFSKEERELYALLEDYRNDIDKEKKLPIPANNNSEKTHNVSAEEIQLQELLEKAIKDQRTLEK